MRQIDHRLNKEVILAQRGNMDPGLKNYIANVINEGNVGEDVMDGALKVIEAGVSIDGGEDGLVEVEIDQIDDATLWKLHDYLVA